MKNSTVDSINFKSIFTLKLLNQTAPTYFYLLKIIFYLLSNKALISLVCTSNKLKYKKEKSLNIFLVDVI